MESLWYDLRHALRHLGRRPLFTAVACLSIAIGVGATTTIFSIVNAVLLRAPDGVAEPGRVVEVTRTVGGRGRDSFSYPELLDLRVMAGDAFAHLAAWRGATLSYSGTGEGERLSAMVISHDYFEVMGVRPLRGRFFYAEEDRTPLAHPVAVVSERFWRDRLDAAPDVAGRTIELNRRTFTIVGVVPAAFRGHVFGFSTQVWVPMMMMGAVRPGFDRFEDRYSSWLTAVARLQPGVSIEQARSSAQAAFARMPQRATDPRNTRSAAVDALGLMPAAGRAPVSAFFAILFALVGIILVVTCANVGGMLLARAAAREREIAVRLALGSGRARLVRQLLLESSVLFVAGGAAGIVVAVWLAGLLARIPLPAPVPFQPAFAPDARVFVFGLTIALVTGAVFGLAPALQVTQPDLASMMKATGVAAGRGGRLRNAFVKAQIGLSLVLLVSAGLFLRSLQRAAAVPTGFEAADVATVGFDLAIDGYDAPRGLAFVDELRTRLATAPGVTGSGLATDLPLDLGITETPAWMPGSPAADVEGRVPSALTVVSPGYFETLRVPLLSGRLFDARDVAGATPAIIVSRAFAERVWPGGEPIGQLVQVGTADATPRAVVGVVEDVKQQTLMEALQPAMYLPLAQSWDTGLSLVVRGAPAADLAATVRRVLRETDPKLSTTGIERLEAVVSLGTLPQRFAAGATSLLGALALLLSALGVYGVVAFTVARRTKEIGVRRALGAQDRDVIRLVLRGGLALAVPGIVVGIGAGLVLSRLLRSFILGVAPGDPVTFLAGPAILLIAVVLACWAPARRALAAQPTEALRAE